MEDMLLVHSLAGDAGRDELRTHPALEVCEQARALVDMHAQAMGVTVSVPAPPQSGLAVRTDMLAAAHALAILLTMTVDAAAPGGEVVMRVETRDPWVVYKVEGAPLRMDATRPISASGSATLPLTIARSLIARVGGLLDAELPAQEQMALSIRFPAG